MSKFDYPRLSRAEIITILAESQVADVSDYDLKSLTSDFVSDLYTRLLIYLDVIHEEEQGQFEFVALEHLENPDHHVDSARMMNLYIKIKELLTLLACPWKFNIKDLIKPQADSNEIFLSAILNFSLHKNTKMDLLRPVVDELGLLEDKQKEWEVKIEQLTADIEELNAARQMEMPAVQELSVQVKDLHQRIAGLNSQQMSLRAAYRKLKEKSAEMGGEISNAEFELVQSVQESANLRSKIVQSPDKLQRALEEKKLVQEEARNAESLAMQSFQEKTAILEVYGKASKKMLKHLTQMQSIQEQVNSSKSIEKDYKAIKAKLSEDRVIDKLLDAKLVERREKAQQLDESRKMLEKEKDLKCEVAAKEFNSVKLEVESRRCDLEVRQEKVDAILAEVEATTSETNMLRDAGVVKAQQMIQKWEEVVEQYQGYKDSIGYSFLKFEEEQVGCHALKLTSSQARGSRYGTLYVMS